MQTLRRLCAWSTLGILSFSFACAGASVHTKPFEAQCFSPGEAGSVDRSSTTIRVLVRDWASHELVSTVAAFILKEWLGYRVDIVRLQESFSQDVNGHQVALEALQKGAWDVDVENWAVLYPQDFQDELSASSEPMQPIGYSGRSGLYIPRSTAEMHKFADWWKFFSKPGHARSLGFSGPDPDDLRNILGSDFPECNPAQYSWCSRELEGYWMTPLCEQNISSCMQVIMGPPHWDQGYFEQVAANLALPFVFAYYGKDGLRAKQAQLLEQPEDVVFYSWTSNYGTEEDSVARISFPDPLSATVAAEYIRNPNGTNAVDYPEVLLMKVLARTLFQKAPEAYWMFRRLTLGKAELRKLLGPIPLTQQQEVEQSACAFLKANANLISQVAPDCVTQTGPRLNPANAFDRSTGTCTYDTNGEHFQCFDSVYDNRAHPDRPDRSKIVIRFGQRDWLSHDLMRVTAMILIEEKLGYSVRSEDITNEPSRDWAALLERNSMDVEMESWQVDIHDPLVQFYVNGNGIIEPPGPVGWSGRIGMFVMPDVLEKHPFADFYKFYEGSAASDAGFRAPNITELFHVLNGTGFCPTDSEAFWCEGQYAGQYVPKQCRSPDSQCIEALMNNPSWSQGNFEQLAVNHNLSIVLSYYGSQQQNMVERLHQEKTPAIFYGWVPWERAAQFGLSNSVGRISFPDFFRGCAGSVRVPNGPRLCDISPTTVYKIRRKDLADRAPEAAYVIDHLEVTQEQMAHLLTMHKGGGGNLTTRETACYFAKTMTEAVERALPECITNPNPNPKIGDRVWNAAERQCVRLECARNASLIYDSSTGFSRCRICHLENAGTVPADDQMSCKPCPSATSPDELGETCVACPPGRYAHEAASPTCQACPENRYNPLMQQSRCARCPRGAVCFGPDGSNGTGSTSFYAAARHHLLADGDADSKIQAAFAAKMLNCFDCWDRADPLEGIGPFECPVSSACLENNTCILGQRGKPVMEGPLCGRCVSGYQRSTPDEPCNECPPDWLTILVILVVVIGGIGGLCLLSWSQDAALGNLRGVYSIVLKILCNFFVQLKALGQVTDLNGVIKDLSEESLSQAILTSPVAFSLGIGDVLENPSTAIFSLECLMMSGGNNSRDSQYLKVLGAQLLIPLTLLLTWVLAVVCCWTWQMLQPKPLRWVHSSLASRIILTFSSLAVLEMYFLQPMVTSQLLSVFDCSTIGQGDVRRWSYDMSVDCESESHLQWQAATAIGLVLFSFGIPFILYIIPKMILRTKRYTLQSPEMWSVFGFLYDGFEPDFWYYESWMMLRKTYILIAANLFWLSAETRTVLLLTLVIYFRYMHLRDLPFDNRAYQGVDRLQFDSLATFTWLLLGRLFRTMLQMTENSIDESYSPFFYIPAACNFMVLLCRAVYLVLRDIIWPLQSPPTLLPKWLRARLDHRLTFSFIPPAGLDVEDDERKAFKGVEHGSLSGLAGNVAADWFLTNAHTLPNEEREMLKTILTETVEVLLRRHEIVHKEAPQVIYLPTFLLQMERVLVASMCYAVKSRIINEELTNHRDTWGKWAVGVWNDSKSYVKEVLFGRQDNRASRNILRSHSDRPWHDETCQHLANAQHLVKRPISTEEIQIALYSLWPELVDPKKNCEGVENNHLRELVHAHRGIIDMHGSVSHIFDSDTHAASIVRRKTRSVRIDEGINMDMVRQTSESTDEEVTRAMLEDEMPLPSDIRIEAGMVKILKASRRSSSCKLTL